MPGNERGRPTLVRSARVVSGETGEMLCDSLQLRRREMRESLYDFGRLIAECTAFRSARAVERLISRVFGQRFESLHR
jgi:hypothetical protein